MIRELLNSYLGQERVSHPLILAVMHGRLVKRAERLGELGRHILPLVVVLHRKEYGREYTPYSFGKCEAIF